MNGRTIDPSRTPAERIAAAARSCIVKIAGPTVFVPDYADLRDWLSPFIEHEILKDRLARSQEQHASRRHGALMEEVKLVARIQELERIIETQR